MVITTLYSPHRIQSAFSKIQIYFIFICLNHSNCSLFFRVKKAQITLHGDFFTDQLQTREMYSLTILEVRCPKSMCHQSHASSEAPGTNFLCLFLASSWKHQSLLSPSRDQLPSVSVCLYMTFSSQCLFSSYKNNRDTGLEPILIEYDFILT